jgi:SAM-dependent methyltransferase
MNRTLAETQSFFAVRAATWDTRFPDDAPAYARAAGQLAPPRGGRVLDLGTGTGRALCPLHDRLVHDRLVHDGRANGLVVGVDATAEMLTTARRAGRDQYGALVGADAGRLPFTDGCFDAVFAAGILHHLPAPDHGLSELARVTRAGARLAVFHPIGRATLAARHGGTVADDDVLAEANLREVLERCGWTLDMIDDGDDRYLAIAERR